MQHGAVRLLAVLHRQSRLRSLPLPLPQPGWPKHNNHIPLTPTLQKSLIRHLGGPGSRRPYIKEEEIRRPTRPRRNISGISLPPPGAAPIPEVLPFAAFRSSFTLYLHYFPRNFRFSCFMSTMVPLSLFRPHSGRQINLPPDVCN